MTVTMPAARLCAEESVYDLGHRLTKLLIDASQEFKGEQLPDVTRERVADLAEAIRRRTARRAERDPRSLFELDERFIELMDRADEEASSGGEVSAELLSEITEYLEAFRNKVDRIAGYWRWQESIAQICGEEVERLSARKKAADGRVSRLKNMLLAFMTNRGQKKLEGDKASINKQQNSTASLAIDDPLQIADEYFEFPFQLSKRDIREIVEALIPSDLRRRLELALKGEGWEINTSAVRAALLNNAGLKGARLVKGYHVRIR